MALAARSTDDLRSLLSDLAALDPAVDDAERINRLRLFEELKSALCAAQAVTAVQFAASQRAEQVAAGAPTERADRGIAGQLGLALRRSPHAAARFLGFARVATTELPATFAALCAGETTEWRATLVARETAMLSREHRAQVDAELGGRLAESGDRDTERAARQAAYRLDPHAAVARARKAESDRCVTVRPAPDTMAYLTALLPCGQAVAAYAALARHADTVTAVGDERGRGQIMADTLVERLTGQATAEDIGVEVELVVTDATLTGASEEPGELIGYGPVPAGIARDLAAGPAGSDDAARRDQHDVVPRRTMRRLFTTADGTRLVAMESTAREFTAGQRRFLRLRDRICRTPYCGAPIRHADHVRAWARGGPTSILNGEGLCEACNHARQASGWTVAVDPAGTVDTTTPTGHRYRSRAPAPPGADRLTVVDCRRRDITIDPPGWTSRAA